MRRIVQRWLVAMLALGVCASVVAVTTPTGTCERAPRVLERAAPSALAASHAAEARPTPMDPRAPDGVPDAGRVAAKTCTSVALVMPTLANGAPRYAELGGARWHVVSAIARTTGSGIERPPRRA